MKRGEEVHLDTIHRLMRERRVRPSALVPVWQAAGFALGAATALLGKEAAMACTVAVETAISAHYNDQIRQLLDNNAHGQQAAAAGGAADGASVAAGAGAAGARVGAGAGGAAAHHAPSDDARELAEVFRRHRDEELEHHDTAIAHGAKSAPLYGALSAIIQAGCAAAIAVAKKV
jgi:ubiquinone biosynthesis monooxygenase Coq7